MKRDDHRQPIEVNIESTGIAQKKHVFFKNDDNKLQSEEQL